MRINVVMDYLVGGAYVGLLRIASKLPQYSWSFTTKVEQQADIVLYMNNHIHYERAKSFGIRHIIQRKTGERSLVVQTPEDLDAVICASKRSYEYTKHSKKILIYNGIDFEQLSHIIPKPNIDLLVAESRIGVGQRVNLACQYAIEHKQHLTILGSKANLVEDTYYKLKASYPQFNWIGTVGMEEALSYIKGCSALIICNPSHGVANQSIEGVAMDKKIVNLANLEIPDKRDIDINVTAKKYDDLFKTLLDSKAFIGGIK